jgi:hypothetical protein
VKDLSKDVRVHLFYTSMKKAAGKSPPLFSGLAAIAVIGW